jgi:hypothetical protein
VCLFLSAFTTRFYQLTTHDDARRRRQLQIVAK